MDPRSETAGLLRLRDRSLEWRLVADEVMVLDIDQSEFLVVNRSGAPLWGLLAGGASRDQLARALIERYDLDATEAAADVHRFLTFLADRQMLEDAAPLPP